MFPNCVLDRLCASACSWKKLCVCQCSVSVQCCCEPKLPRLRVVPATGDPRLARDQLEPTPPPSYLEIYPDPATEDFTPVSLSLQDQTDTNLLNPHSHFTPDIRSGQDINNLSSRLACSRSLTPPPTSRQFSLPREREEELEVPGLADCGDTAELDWASVASFPSQQTSEDNPWNTSNSGDDIFTIYNR